MLPECRDVLLSDPFRQLLLLTLQDASEDFEEGRNAPIRRDEVLVRVLPLRLKLRMNRVEIQAKDAKVFFGLILRVVLAQESLWADKPSQVIPGKPFQRELLLAQVKEANLVLKRARLV